MKIAIIHCSFIYRGGGERIVFEQIDYLRSKGHTVVCFAPVVDKKICFPDIIDKYNIKTFFPQLPDWFPLRHAILMLLSCIFIPFFSFKFRKFDAIVGENQPGAWIAFVVCRILRKEYIVYLNHPNRILYPRANEDWAAVSDFYFLNQLFKFFHSILVFLDRISINSAKERLVNGYFIGREIEKIYGSSWKACPSGAHFVEEGHNMAIKTEPRFFEQIGELLLGGSLRGVSYLKSDSDKKHFNSFLLKAEEYFDVRQKNYADSFCINGFNLDGLYILYTGRHQPWKRIDWLIESYSMLSSELQANVKLVIPGPFTPHTFELIDLVKKLNLENRVLFVGEISQKQLEALYLNASVYGFASEKEDFGIVVIEAMGYGLPVVAWNVGGPTDTVVSGVTGYLIDRYDRKEFSNKLELLLRDSELRMTLGDAGKARVKKLFTWKQHIEVLETAIYSSV